MEYPGSELNVGTSWMKSWRFRAQICVIAVCFTLLLPWLLLLVILPSLLLRILVSFIAEIIRPDLDGIYSDVGVNFALESIHKNPKCSIVIHLTCDRIVALDNLLKLMQERVLDLRHKTGGKQVYRRLRQIYTQYLGFMFWKWDEAFDLKNHIRLYDYTDSALALPSACTEVEVQRITGDLLAQPWPEGQSPWEILLIPKVRRDENKNSPTEEYSIITFRVHHGLCDGYSLLDLILQLFDSDGGKEAAQNQTKVTSLWQRIMLPMATALRFPYDLAKFFTYIQDGPSDWHLVDVKLSRKYHSFFSDAIPVEKIKRIRQQHGTSYTSVVCAVTFGAMRKMMLQAGQRVPQTMSAIIPLPLANHPSGLCNHYTAMGIRFSPSLRTAKERLQEISNVFKDLQGSPTTTLSVSWYAGWLASLPVPLLRLVRIQPVSMGLSNFPGPEKELECEALGHLHVVGAIPAIGHVTGSVGTVVSMLSAVGVQRIVLTVDRMIFTNYRVPQNFAELINEEVDHLLKNSTHGINGIQNYCGDSIV